MSAAVPSRARGTVTPGMIVAHVFRRKMKITITTSAMVSIRVNSTSFTDAVIVVVRLTTVSILIEEGIDCAVWSGEIEESSFVVRRVGFLYFGTCAARYCGRAITRTAVGDDYPIDDTARQRRNLNAMRRKLGGGKSKPSDDEPAAWRALGFAG